MIRKIMYRPQAVLGLVMMLLVFLVMLLAPVFAPNDPMQLNVPSPWWGSLSQKRPASSCLL